MRRSSLPDRVLGSLEVTKDFLIAALIAAALWALLAGGCYGVLLLLGAKSIEALALAATITGPACLVFFLALFTSP